MHHVIDWKLFNNNKLLVHRKNVSVIYDYNNKLIYETTDEYNEIDFKMKKYIRRTNELEMIIEFENNICIFDFKEEGNCKIDIKSSFKLDGDDIILKYTIDEDEKKIIINLIDGEFN